QKATRPSQASLCRLFFVDPTHTCPCRTGSLEGQSCCSLEPDASFLTRLSLRRGQPLNQSGSPRRRHGPMAFSRSLMVRHFRFHSNRPFVEALESRNLLSFIAAPTYAAGGYPISVAVGDFNGDGIP